MESPRASWNSQLVAQQKLDLVLSQPRMYPVRSRGVLRGQCYFYLEPYLFYYSLTPTEVRVNAILPRGLRRS